MPGNQAIQKPSKGKKMLRFPISRSVPFIVLSLICFAGCGNNTNQTGPVNSATPANSPAVSTVASPSPANTPSAKLNVNTASGAELMSTIPNFSNRMVHEFEEYRPYRSIQVFRREIGKYVAPTVVAEYEKYIDRMTPPERGKYYQCPDLTKGDLIGWKLEKNVKDANCIINR